MKTNPLIGKVVRAVFLAEGGGAIRFDFADGDGIIVQADGDCCSHTWIEEVQGADQIVGSEIVSVEDVGGVRETEETDGDCLQFYGCKITSLKGYALIDYRNSSNGYYGGNLSWPGESFYGGVFGQNGKHETWRELIAV